MSNFPLYTSIMSGIPDKDLTAVQKADFLKKVDAMNLEGHELLYALIKTFYIDNDHNSPFIAPYGGSLNREGISFDMDDIPHRLRQILYKFSKIHMKKLKEDRKLEQGRIID